MLGKLLGTLILVGLLLTLCAPPFIHAQGSGGDELRFDRAVFDSGTQNSGAIIQDRDGFIWIGTNAAGLIRYDGYDVKVYKPGGPNSLEDPYVLTLYEDSQGLIWIGAATGLFRYDKETDAFTKYQHDPQNPASISGNARTLSYMQTIVEDQDGLLWIGTTQGLNAFDRKTETFTRYLHNPADPNSLSNNDVRALLVDRQGFLWIGTNGGGLDRLERKSGAFTHYAHNPDDSRSLGDNVVTALVEDDEGTLWIGTQEDGLQRFDRNSGAFTHYPHDPNNANSPGDNYFFSLYEDSSGVIWMGYAGVAGAGVTAFDKRTQTFTHYTHDPGDPNTISTPAITSVYEDRAGILWFVNDVGAVDKYDPHRYKFKLYGSDPDDPNSLIASPVVPIYQDSSGTLWIGTFPGWQKYDKQTRTFTRYIKDIYFPGVYEDSSGTLWLGSGVPCALHIFDRAAGKIVKTYTHDPNNPGSLSQCMQINAIVQDLDDPNILWLVAANGTAGLEKFDKRTGAFAHYGHDPNNPNTLSSNDLWMLHRDREGILWLPTIGGGLDRFDPRTETFTHYAHNPDDPHSISSNATNVVFEDSSGNLWIGGAAGLDKFDRATETFTRYTGETGYPVTSILSIGEDKQGKLWLASGGGDGLAKFDPRTETIRFYRASDGLPSDVFFVRNGLRDRDGEMWFGGPNGMTSFYPEEIVDNPYIPAVVVTALKQGGEDMKIGKAPERVREIVLDWRHNFFEFEYAALNYTQAQKNQYKYMLEGLDKDWFNAGARRFGRYSGLPGGDYVLRIIGSNNDGVWNEEGVSIHVKVIPAIWQTWEFYGLCALIILGIIVGGFYYRTEQLGRFARQLEQKVKERTAELAQANDSLAQANAELSQAKQVAEQARERAEVASRAKSAFLANMSHELRTPLNGILGYAQILQRRKLEPDVLNGLGIIHKSGEHLLTLINDILDLSKIEAGRMELYPAPTHLPALLEHIVSIIHARAEARQLTFSFETPTPLPAQVHADETRLRQILLNLLGNAVKFTDAGHVTLRVEQISDRQPKGAASQRESAETVRSCADSLTRLRFQVQDTGIGIPPNQLERIFQPFEQAQNAARRTEGTGLGLAISRQLVQLMGGELHVQSQPGLGSAFWFEVALPVTQTVPEAPPPSERLITGYSGPRRTVLVVDDIPSNRAVLADLLRPLGFDVAQATDGLQAIHLAREIHPHLILMDRWMPVLDGLDAARQIRQTPGLETIPIIAVSASVSPQDQAHSQGMGIDAFLPKPVHWPRLAALLQEYLALEWKYADEESIEPKPDAVILPPPQDELAILHDLAMRGNMRAILQRAAHIEALGESYAPFAAQLRQMASAFEVKQLLEWIKHYLEEAQ